MNNQLLLYGMINTTLYGMVTTLYGMITTLYGMIAALYGMDLLTLAHLNNRRLSIVNTDMTKYIFIKEFILKMLIAIIVANRIKKK